MTPCLFNAQISLIVASIFHISAVYGPIWLCFGYDAPIGPFYHDPIDWFRGPLLERTSLERTSFERMFFERTSLEGTSF